MSKRLAVYPLAAETGFGKHVSKSQKPRNETNDDEARAQKRRGSREVVDRALSLRLRVLERRLRVPENHQLGQRPASASAALEMKHPVSPMADKTFHKVHWAKVRTFAQALRSIRTCIQRAVKPPQSPRKGHSIKIHSEYIGKLRQGVKSGAAAAAFDLTATARQAAEEAEQLMATGGIVTSVEDAADLEKVEYWQQGDANLATKENMEARKALRYHKVVLEALQIYWEAAQRSLQSGGDSSAD